jgi:hypothetical protein
MLVDGRTSDHPALGQVIAHGWADGGMVGHTANGSAAFNFLRRLFLSHYVGLCCDMWYQTYRRRRCQEDLWQRISVHAETLPAAKGQSW